MTLSDEIVEELVEITSLCKTCADLFKIIEFVDTDYDLHSISKLRTTIVESSEVQCKICKAPRLSLLQFKDLSWVPDPTPDEKNPGKFQKFGDLYGKDTAETFRPSYVENLDEGNKKLLVKEKVQGKIFCTNCSRPRVVYGDKKTFKNHNNIITSQIETLLFICGMSVFPSGHSLESSVVSRKMVNCESPIEIQYYSSKIFPDVCYWCGKANEFATVPEDLKKNYRKIYPMCITCQNDRKKFHARLPLKGLKRGGDKIVKNSKKTKK